MTGKGILQGDENGNKGEGGRDNIECQNRSPHHEDKEVTIYIDRTSIEDDTDTIGREGEYNHLKEYKVVIINI